MLGPLATMLAFAPNSGSCFSVVMPDVMMPVEGVELARVHADGVFPRAKCVHCSLAVRRSRGTVAVGVVDVAFWLANLRFQPEGSEPKRAQARWYEATSLGAFGSWRRGSIYALGVVVQILRSLM